MWLFKSNISIDGETIHKPFETTFWWGVGLAFHYISVFVLPKFHSVENEYDKLKNNS